MLHDNRLERINSIYDEIIPVANIDVNWLKTELLVSLEILSNRGFCVRVIVCNNHPSNVSSFKKLLKHVNQNPDELYVLRKSRKIYFCYNAVHLIKNLRNNLWKCKRCVFHPFEFCGFKDPINVPGGEIAWKTFRDVFERDANLHANFRKAPNLKTKVLYPGNCKQNVSNALAIFDETTIAAMKSYFPEKASATAFLTLFSKWWVFSNSKARYSTANYLGNAAAVGDNKPCFLRTMADWIQNWREKKIANCEKFTLT